MKTKKIIGASILIWIISALIGWITCGWLFSWIYSLPPTSLWKGPELMMTAGNMAGMYLIGLVAAFIFTLVFVALFKGLPYKGAKKGATYGFLIWAVGALVGMATMPFYMNIATAVVIYWIVVALVTNVINGALVGAIIKKK